MLSAAVRAELTKIACLRAVWIGTGVILALHLLLSAVNLDATTDAVAAITPAGTIELFTGDHQPADRAVLESLVASSFQMCVFLPGMAAVIAGQEFRSGQLGRSLLAVPDRGRLVIAKVVATGAYLSSVAVVIAAISTVFRYVAVRNWNPGLLVGAAAWRGQGAFLAFAVLTGLTALAVTLVARGTLAGIAVTTVLTALTMTQLVAAFAPGLDALLPMSAGRNLLLDRATGTLTAGPGHALAVLCAWPAVTAAAAWVALGRRDAR